MAQLFRRAQIPFITKQWFILMSNLIIYVVIICKWWLNFYLIRVTLDLFEKVNNFFISGKL